MTTNKFICGIALGACTVALAEHVSDSFATGFFAGAIVLFIFNMIVGD
jgi:hypothetical protein